MDFQGKPPFKNSIALMALIVAGFPCAPTLSQAMAQNSPGFSLPVDCPAEAPCFLQNLVDIDASPQRLDGLCGRATYNGHKGTDFRVRNVDTLKLGIPVFAIADGVVRATRDGEPDRLLSSKSDIKQLKGRDCGNGVIIDHGKIKQAKWQTQTCHLAKGSVLVRSGQKIKRGEQIGKMGLSGRTQFPHVHVSVRRNGKIIDPITGLLPGNLCNSLAKTSLFSAKAQDELTKMNGPLLQLGFANGPVNSASLSTNTVQKPNRDGPIVFYAKFFNLKKGDYFRLRILSNDGLLTKNSTKPLTKAKSTYTVFTGKKGKLEPGVYKGEIELIRRKVVVHKSAKSILVK